MQNIRKYDTTEGSVEQYRVDPCIGEHHVLDRTMTDCPVSAAQPSVLYFTILYSSDLYSTVLCYSTMLYSSVFYCTSLPTSRPLFAPTHLAKIYNSDLKQPRLVVSVPIFELQQQYSCGCHIQHKNCPSKIFLLLLLGSPEIQF